MKSNFTLNLIFVLFISFSTTFTFQSCSVDKCESVECLNGGACHEGVCDCKADFSGNKCEIDIRSECEKNNTAEVIFENLSNDQYDCFVNGSLIGRVDGGKTLTISTSLGYTTYLAISVIGYSILTGNSTLEKCEEAKLVIP